MASRSLQQPHFFSVLKSIVYKRISEHDPWKLVRSADNITITIKRDTSLSNHSDVSNVSRDASSIVLIVPMGLGLDSAIKLGLGSLDRRTKAQHHLSAYFVESERLVKLFTTNDRMQQMQICLRFKLDNDLNSFYQIFNQLGLTMERIRTTQAQSQPRRPPEPRRVSNMTAMQPYASDWDQDLVQQEHFERISSPFVEQNNPQFMLSNAFTNTSRSSSPIVRLTTPATAQAFSPSGSQIPMSQANQRRAQSSLGNHFHPQQGRVKFVARKRYVDSPRQSTSSSQRHAPQRVFLQDYDSQPYNNHDYGTSQTGEGSQLIQSRNHRSSSAIPSYPVEHLSQGTVPLPRIPRVPSSQPAALLNSYPSRDPEPSVSRFFETGDGYNIQRSRSTVVFQEEQPPPFRELPFRPSSARQAMSRDAEPSHGRPASETHSGRKRKALEAVGQTSVVQRATPGVVNSGEQDARQKQRIRFVSKAVHNTVDKPDAKRQKVDAKASQTNPPKAFQRKVVSPPQDRRPVPSNSPSDGLGSCLNKTTKSGDFLMPSNDRCAVSSHGLDASSQATLLSEEAAIPPQSATSLGESTTHSAEASVSGDVLSAATIKLTWDVSAISRAYDARLDTYAMTDRKAFQRLFLERRRKIANLCKVAEDSYGEEIFKYVHRLAKRLLTDEV